MAKLGAQTLTFNRLDRQTDKKTLLAAPAAGEIRAPPYLHGDRGPRAHSCTSKTFGGLTHNFAARGRRIFGGNQTPST